MTLDYFYGQAGELFSFYRIPKALFQEQRFQTLSTDAKTLYGILLDRMSLSAKNGWLDEQGRVFIIFTIEDVKRALCCADNKATKLLRELEEFGLIERKRRGLGKPSLVYVKNFSAESSKESVKNRDFHDSCGSKITCQDPVKSRGIKKKENKTEMNNTNPILSDESEGMKNRELLEEYFSCSLEIDLLLRLYPDDEDLYCADCGRRLTLQTHYSKKDGSTQYSYRCGGYASRVNGCTAHSISADNVEALILASVKRFSRFVLKDEETFALELQSLWREKREEKPKQNQSELKRCQKRYDELSALIRSLYENLMSGLLPERQYKQLMAQYDSEQAELESQMETMKSEIAEDKSSSADIRHFISLIRKCKNPTEISDSMFNELVDKIVVYEAEGAGNARTQKVDIYFNYVGQVDIAYTEEELAELKAQKEQEERQRMEKQRKREKAYREKRKAKKIAKNGGEIIKTKTCPHCGKVFTPTSNRQLFCSRECWNQARLEQKKADREAERGTHYYRQRTCAVCGHSYWPTHSQQEFCSDECRRINHNKKTLEFYHKKKGNLKPDPEATPTPKPKEDNAA